jgi:hypothetical protein
MSTDLNVKLKEILTSIKEYPHCLYEQTGVKSSAAQRLAHAIISSHGGVTIENKQLAEEAISVLADGLDPNGDVDQMDVFSSAIQRLSTIQWN